MPWKVKPGRKCTRKIFSSLSETWEQGPPCVASSRGTETFRQRDSSQPAGRTFIKLAPGISEQDVAVKSPYPWVFERSWHRGWQTCPRAMAKSGLVISILVITLLLDQTTSHAAKFKAKKHSKRRVKGNGASLSGKARGLLGVGRGCPFPNASRRLCDCTMPSCAYGIFRGPSNSPGQFDS